MHYLQKIVQLPFQIPVWSSVDLSNVIRNLVKEARLSESYSNEILKETNQELIIKATQLNPRDIKRFINSIVLARDIYGQDIKDIDKIIAIQAFYFHGHKWIEFLKLLITYEQRIKFLMHFILLVETKLKDITILDDLRNIIEDEKYKEKEDYLYKSLALQTKIIETVRHDPRIENETM
jgi:KAP family P-loop domain